MATWHLGEWLLIQLTDIRDKCACPGEVRDRSKIQLARIWKGDRLKQQTAVT